MGISNVLNQHLSRSQITPVLQYFSCAYEYKPKFMILLSSLIVILLSLCFRRHLKKRVPGNLLEFPATFADSRMLEFVLIKDGSTVYFLASVLKGSR